MVVRVVEREDVVLAKHISTGELQSGLSFYSNDDDFIQVGSWRYDQGKELLAHMHNEVERVVVRTQEVLFVLKGKILAEIYDTNERLVEEIIAKTGDVLILLHGAHGYKILEDDTQVVEIKNGPYLGAEIDRRRI